MFKAKLFNFLTKHIKGFIIFFTIEVATAILIRPSDWESFFMFWAFIPFAIFVYSFVDLGSAKDAHFSSNNQYSNLKMLELEKKYDKTRKYSKRNIQFDSISIFFIIAMIINIILYILYK